MSTGVTITIFTQANIDAGRVVFTHGSAAVTSESFTFTVSDGVETEVLEAQAPDQVPAPGPAVV